MRMRFDLSASVSDAETAQSLLMDSVDQRRYLETGASEAPHEADDDRHALGAKPAQMAVEPGRRASKSTARPVSRQAAAQRSTSGRRPAEPAGRLRHHRCENGLSRPAMRRARGARFGLAVALLEEAKRRSPGLVELDVN
jgi:hypothetical protein